MGGSIRSTLSDLPARMDTVGRPTVPLVGRAAERAALLDLLADARGGRAGAVILSGEAGVGKSRLLNDILEAAVAEGMRPLVGHCVDFTDSGLPYLPFTEIVTQLPLADGRRRAGPVAARSSHDARFGAPTTASIAACCSKTILTALEDAAEQQPVLVVIEDAHWADQACRDLLGFLLSRLGVDPDRAGRVLSQ